MAHSYEKIGKGTGLIKVGRELSSGRRNAVNELRDICIEVEKQGVVDMVLDFSKVKVCPSVVFGNIIVLAKRLKEKGGRVTIASPSTHVAKAAKITGLTNIVAIADNVEEAMKELK